MLRMLLPPEELSLFSAGSHHPSSCLASSVSLSCMPLLATKRWIQPMCADVSFCLNAPYATMLSRFVSSQEGSPILSRCRQPNRRQQRGYKRRKFRALVPFNVIPSLLIESLAGPSKRARKRSRGRRALLAFLDILLTRCALFVELGWPG
jgi:hypothetical protein